MGFCASCGRQRDGDARFCAGCGAEFTEPAPAADATRTEPVRDGAPAEETDPFASWYQREPQPAPAGQNPGGQGAGGQNWEVTQTVGPGSGQPPGAAPPPTFPAAHPGPPGAPAGRPNRGRGLFLTVAAIVVLAAGGGAYALASSLGKHPGKQPTASGSTTPAQPTRPATAPASEAPSPALSLVAVSPSVTGAAEPQVETLLSHYFHGINTHNYQEYAGTLNPERLAQQPEEQFNTGFATTTDSGMTLTSLTSGNGNGNGGMVATVTFTSHQSPASSIDKRACNLWTLDFYLVPQPGGTSYLIGPAPHGYQPAFSDC